MASAMRNLTRRDFLRTASATIATIAAPNVLRIAAQGQAKTRVLIGSHGDNGILAYDWDPETAALTAAGVAAKIPESRVAGDYSRGGHRAFVYSASELDTFEDKPTGEVASFRVAGGELQPLSARNSAGTGTCHVAADSYRANADRRRLHGRERGQLPHRRRQAERGGVDRALHRARAEPRQTENGTRAFRVVLARQPVCLHKRPGRRLDSYLQAQSCDGRDDACGNLSRRVRARARARCISIPTATPRTA